MWIAPKRRKLIAKRLICFEMTSVSSGVRTNSCFEHTHLFSNISKMMHIFRFSEYFHEIELVPEIRIQTAPKEDNCWKSETTDNPFFVLLYEFPAETRLTVYRRFDILTNSSIWQPLPPRTSVMLDVEISILLRLCIWVTSSVLSKVLEPEWSFISPEYQISR